MIAFLIFANAKTLPKLVTEALMGVLLILIPVSLLLAGVALGGCVWAIRSGQYDDVQTPAERLPLEDKISTNHL